MISYNWVTRRLATGGGITTPEDFEILVHDGVTAVIDCCESDDAAILGAHTNVSYLWNPTADDGAPKSPEWFKRSVQFALPLLTQPHQKCYAHCAAGINRGPSTAFAILLALGLYPAQAEQIIRSLRPEVGLRYKNDAIVAVQVLGYV